MGNRKSTCLYIDKEILETAKKMDLAKQFINWGIGFLRSSGVRRTEGCIMKVRYPGLMSLLILNLLAILISPGGATFNELVEGQHPIYIVKEVVKVTSDWTDVKWIQGPDVILVRHQVVEGVDAPEFQSSVSGLGVWVAKRQYDTTRVVIEVEALTLRGDITALVNIEGGDLGYTKVELNAYDITASNFVNLYEFLNQGGSPKDFELELSTLYEMPSATANVEEAVKELKKKVFAFYYPWYASPAGPSDLWFHWTRVTKESIADSAHYPLLGAYDSADEAVLLAHMTIAKHAGIDGFIVSWWGIDTFEDNQISRILGVAEQVGFQISIYYESVRDITQDDIVEELTYVVNSYADSPSFLKDSGRPVVFIYAVPYLERDPSFWLEVRRRVEANVGPIVLIGDTQEEEYLHVFDGFHTYIFLGDNIEDFYRDAIERLSIGLSSIEEVNEAFSSAYSGEEVSVNLKSFSLTVTPGYDDTKIRSPSHKLDRQAGEVYKRFWRKAIDIDVHSVLITSWNEWHEGTEIEPSREYEFDYINLTRQFVEEYKQTSLRIPEARLSATVESLEQYSNLTGIGKIVLTAETAALYINIDISGKEGILYLDLQGDFYTYLKDCKKSSASIVIPSIPSQSNLVVKVVYKAELIKPLFNISITAYDPSGRLHELYAGQLRPIAITPTLTPTTTPTPPPTSSLTPTPTPPPKPTAPEHLYVPIEIAIIFAIIVAIVSVGITVAVMRRRIRKRSIDTKLLNSQLIKP